MSEWIKYKEEKPTKPGFYEWRIPSDALDGVFLIVAEEMRWRGAGVDSVLSPEFDFWDGYRVHVRCDVEWRGAPIEGLDKGGILGVEGLHISDCIYCGQKPNIKAWRITECGKVSFSSSPWMLNRFGFECCNWGSTPKLESPFEVEERRRKTVADACADYMTWRPIETAPKDTAVICCNELGHVGEACFISGIDNPAWYWASDPQQIPLSLHPTHWMPLPEPPKECKSEYSYI